jgi:WD40 repeat protein
MTLSGNHIKLWNVWEKSSARLVGHSSQINSIEFSEDGESLLSSSNDETVKLWDLATGQSKTFYGHSHYVTEALFKGNEILSSSFDKTVRKWSIESGESQILETFKGGMLGGINSLAYSSENDLIAASSFLRTTFINPSTKEVLEFKNKAPSRLKFSKNGTILVSSSMKNIITLRDTNFKEITSFALNTNRINDISISKGGDCFISGADDGKVLSINGQSGEATLITKQVGKVNSVDCSSNGTLVASGGVSRSLIISNLVTGNSEEFTGFSAEITSVVFSKDGRKIATGLANGNILILDIEHLKQPSTYWHSLSNEYRDKTKVFLKDLGIHTTEFTPNLYGVARSKVRELNDHPLYLREGKNKNELMKLGIIAQKDNDWDKARRLYRQAKTMGHGKADSRLRLLSLMEKEHYRVKRLISPEVLKPEELLFNRANMLKKEGDIQLQLNKLDKALSAYALSKQGLENLIKETPKKVELADLLSDLYLKEGDIKTRKNNKIQAKKSYEATIEILERFSWAFPENTVLMERLANSYNKAERIYFQLGELEEFLIFGEKVKAFIGSQLLIYPENTFLLKAQCSTYRSLANYYLRFNLENDALVSLKRCETSYEKVAKLSPSDVSVKSTLFYYYQEISVLYAKQKSNKFAEEYLWSKIKYFGIDELSSNKIELISRVSEIYMYWSWWALSNKNTIARIPYILGRAKGFISPSTDRYIVIQTNLAHALILTGKYDQAKKVYSKYKAYMFESGNSWDSVILKDFEDLRGYGVTHPDFSRIAKEVFNTEI